MRISDWSSDVCSSDLEAEFGTSSRRRAGPAEEGPDAAAQPGASLAEGGRGLDPGGAAARQPARPRSAEPRLSPVGPGAPAAGLGHHPDELLPLSPVPARAVERRKGAVPGLLRGLALAARGQREGARAARQGQGYHGEAAG